MTSYGREYWSLSWFWVFLAVVNSYIFNMLIDSHGLLCYICHRPVLTKSISCDYTPTNIIKRILLALNCECLLNCSGAQVMRSAISVRWLREKSFKMTAENFDADTCFEFTKSSQNCVIWLITDLLFVMSSPLVTNYNFPNEKCSLLLHVSRHR